MGHKSVYFLRQRDKTDQSGAAWSSTEDVPRASGINQITTQIAELDDVRVPRASG